MNRHPKILNRAKTALLVIDIQEKILPAIFEGERVVENSLKLISGFKVMNLPIYFTEQYSKGLGRTESKLIAALSPQIPADKMTFSCSGAGNLFGEFKEKNLEQIVVCGVESHVCVMQTVLDLLSNDFQVHVASDAVSSRRNYDYKTALRRMEKNGAEISLTESVLFELLNICGTDEFRAVSKLVK